MNLHAVTQSLGGLTLLALVLALALLGFLATRGGRSRLATEAEGGAQLFLALACLVAAAAAGGSLYYSGVAGFVPCVLCWYQRIAMYPLVLILAVAALTADWKVWRYAIPIVTVGFFISAYHVLIQLRPALDAGACEEGVPCTARYVAALGFISIPFMAGAAFLLVGALVLAARLTPPPSARS